MEPFVVEFPLRGEWIAPNTPGYRIPSHGTDQLAQTYAYDLMQIDWRYPKSYRFFKKHYMKALLFGVPLKECLCWSQPIFAPFDCEVVEAEDGTKERDPVHFFRDMYLVIKNGFLFKAKNNRDMRHLLGNYMILKGQHCYAFMAHARNGSITVKPGDKIKTGQKLAEVGHSGNSTTPHLHFQLMDGPNLMSATGLPCCFRKYEVYEEGVWREIDKGIPGRYDRIRYVEMEKENAEITKKPIVV